MRHNFVVLLTVLVFVMEMENSVEEVDNSATLDYLYYNTIETGVSLLDQTFLNFDFDPDRVS